MAEQTTVNVNEASMSTSYANAFRQHANKHEVIVDLGVNVVTKDQSTGKATMNLKLDNRVVMNYATAKRLAGTLVQIIQAHEKQFGEIKLD